jgi:hypothetical protein
MQLFNLTVITSAAPVESYIIVLRQDKNVNFLSPVLKINVSRVLTDIEKIQIKL